MKTPIGVIAAGHSLTVEAAEQMLRAGGNAYDAVLAGMCAACAAEPVLASPGGGGFLLAQPASGGPCLYDFFAHTPAVRRPESELDFYSFIADFGTAQQEFHIGRGTVAVPGVIRGLFEIHDDLCRMPMTEIVAPAVSHARHGVAQTPFQSYLFQVIKGTCLATPAVRAIFESPTKAGDTVLEGEVLYQRELADALESLAIEGDDLFYRGEIAGAIDKDMRDGGQISRRDLEAYRVERRKPLAVDYGDRRVLTNPPPSSGGVLIALGLKLAEHIGVGESPYGSPEHVDLLAKVMQATTNARLESGTGPNAQALDETALLDPALVQRYCDDIRARSRAFRGTTQITVIDGAGNVASLTISNGEGSGYVAPGTGIVLNNMLGEEDLNPEGFHRWPTAHRMTSMMAPTMVLRRDGEIVATGSGGSNRIRSAILQVLLNLIDRGMSLEEAVNAPRLHLEGELLSLEGGFDREQLAALLDAYPEHRLWQEQNMFFGGAHSCLRNRRGLVGVGDPRRGGVSLIVA